MDFELHPGVSLVSGTFNVLIAPGQMLVEALNGHQSLQRFKVLYVCGNYSRILSSMDHRFAALEIRRAFTVFQLMTILEENRHTLMILEHDPLLYEDAKEMAEYVARAMKEAANGSIVLLYSPVSDPFLEEIMKNADRVFCFSEGPRASARPSAKNCRKAQGQATLEAF